MIKGVIIFALLCFLVSAILIFIMFMSYKKRLKKELQEAEAEKKTVENITEKYAKEKKENEELVQKMHSGSNLDSANASVELLQKLSEKGKQRNSK